MIENSIKHICIFTQSPLSRAPRVVKEANVYARAGYKVIVYGLWFENIILKEDKSLLENSIKYKAGVNLLDSISFYSKKIRLQRLIGRTLVKYFGVQNVWALGYDFNNYLKKLLTENADIYIGHEEMSMALGKELIKKGKKVAFDFEDWHSKDLLPYDRAHRPIKLLEHLENYLLNKSAYCYTTSDAMATALSHYYNAPKPQVVYNSFLASSRMNMDGHYKDIKHHQLTSVYWFSQVIGPGRGLELLFEALPMVQTPFQLHLRGRISDNYRQLLITLTPKHIELYFHDLVSPEELISRIAEHDLGIAFEETKPESRNYTITNKVFHYLQSGIPILATETAGQSEVAQKSPNAIKVVKRTSKKIAKALDEILDNKQELVHMKTASWQLGKNVFSFENQETLLLRMLKGSLDFSV